LEAGTFDTASHHPVAKKTIYGLFGKRFFDLLFGSILFIFSLPVMLLAALVIMIDNPGSPIYKQKRIGKHGTVFELYKIRTMYSDQEHHGFRTTHSDIRVTRRGKLLRSTKIDELPQLFNVIKGDMSLIGPRPLSVSEFEYIESLGFAETHPGFCPEVMPGLTGLEQVNRAGLHMPYSDRFIFNRFYETHLSLWWDIKILVKTFLLCAPVCILLGLAGLFELVWLSLPLF
jgi:lipopolysaccharide/colanic/teichoic acid biosynthesis glycosyltransferase